MESKKLILYLVFHLFVNAFDKTDPQFSKQKQMNLQITNSKENVKRNKNREAEKIENFKTMFVFRISGFTRGKQNVNVFFFLKVQFSLLVTESYFSRWFLAIDYTYSVSLIII